jgi:hypothetical protein
MSVMHKFVWLGLLAGVSLFLPVPAPAAEMMKPGLWEITTSMEMPGMPYQAPPQTMRHCYTAQEVKEEPVPKDNNCKITDLKSSGNKVSWKLECKGEMAGKGEGEMVYLGDSAYEGKTKMQTQGMTMTSKYKGKRLGDCK